MGQTPPADNSEHELDYFRQPRADRDIMQAWIGDGPLLN